MAITFYHVTEPTPAAADAAVARLLGKAVHGQNPGQVYIVAPSTERAVRLDAALWAEPPTSFVPHALHTSDLGDRAPVVLGVVGEAAMTAPLQIILGGAEAALPTAPLPASQRVAYVFEGAEARVTAARVAWKNLKAAGHTLAYFQHSAQGWQKKA